MRWLPCAAASANIKITTLLRIKKAHHSSNCKNIIYYIIRNHLMVQKFCFGNLVYSKTELVTWSLGFIVFKSLFTFYILLSPTCRGGSLASDSVFGFSPPFSPHCVQSPLTVRLHMHVYNCICMCECACFWQCVCVSACLPRPPVEITLQGVWNSSGGLLWFTYLIKKIWKRRERAIILSLK